MITTYTKQNKHGRKIWVKQDYAFLAYQCGNIYKYRSFRFNHRLNRWERYFPKVEKEKHFNYTLKGEEKLHDFRLCGGVRRVRT
jgi:hypothetical protein